MAKPYHLMTPAERLADRIRRNKQMDERLGIDRNRHEVCEFLRESDRVSWLRFRDPVGHTNMPGHGFPVQRTFGQRAGLPKNVVAVNGFPVEVGK